MAMTNEEEIRAEVEELGRLTEAQEDVLYNIALKQDELGREATNMLLEKVVDSEIYQPMIDREMLTYEVFNKGGKHEIACLYVTLKGMRYCITFGDEISSRRPVGPTPSRRAVLSILGNATRLDGGYSWVAPCDALRSLVDSCFEVREWQTVFWEFLISPTLRLR